MIAAIVILAIALVSVGIYATGIRGKLAAARAENAMLREDEGRFRAIAASVLEDSRRSLSADTSARLADILAPLRQNIDAFNNTISEKYTREASERFALREKIDELTRLNATIGDEARQLSEALRSNGKVQGDWGETILLRLFEQAGFAEGREFDTQRNYKTKTGANVRPDMVLCLPNQGELIIDSKTSITAYANLCSANTAEEQTAASKAHVASVRAHVRELADKRYQDLPEKAVKLDFVLMFIPNDGAYIAALQADPDLWTDAWRRGVVLVSPTQLFAVVKLVQQMWLTDAQNRNAAQIADQAAKMYDKFVGFLTDMQSVGAKLDQARAAHADALNKLSEGRGNLVKQASDLRALGLKTNKSL